MLHDTNHRTIDDQNAHARARDDGETYVRGHDPTVSSCNRGSTVWT